MEEFPQNKEYLGDEKKATFSVCGSISSATDSTRLPSELVLSDESDEDESSNDGDSLPDDDLSMDDSDNSNQQTTKSGLITNVNSSLLEVDESIKINEKIREINPLVTIEKSEETSIRGETDIQKESNINKDSDVPFIEDELNSQNTDDLFLSSTDDEIDDAVEVLSSELEQEQNENVHKKAKVVNKEQDANINLEEKQNTETFTECLSS